MRKSTGNPGQSHEQQVHAGLCKVLTSNYHPNSLASLGIHGHPWGVSAPWTTSSFLVQTISRILPESCSTHHEALISKSNLQVELPQQTSNRKFASASFPSVVNSQCWHGFVIKQLTIAPPTKAFPVLPHLQGSPSGCGVGPSPSPAAAQLSFQLLDPWEPGSWHDPGWWSNTEAPVHGRGHRSLGSC